MREINEIIIHCTDTPEGRDVSVDEVRKWHTLPPPKGNGWSDIGYHYLIMLDGTVCDGRPIEQKGAHCKGHNEHSIGICYVGGTDKKHQPKDTRTNAQKASLVDLCYLLMQHYNITIDNVRVHNEYTDDKACPSFSGDEFREELTEYIREIL